MKRRAKPFLLSFLLFSSSSYHLTSCQNTVINEPLTLKGERKAYLGESYQYTANKEAVIFSVSDNTFGVISNKGVFTPIKAGKVTVFASLGEEKAQIEVSIYSKKGDKTYALEVTSLPRKISYNTGEVFDSTGRKVSLITYVEGEVSKRQETVNYVTDYDGKQFTEAGDIQITVSSKNSYFNIASTFFTVKVNDTFKDFKDQVLSLGRRTNYTLEFTNGSVSYLAKYTDTAFSNGIFDKDNNYIDIRETNGTVNKRVFVNKDGVLNASFYKENNVLEHEVTNDYYVDANTGEKYHPDTLYSVPSFDFRPEVDKEELNKSLERDKDSYSFSASVLTSFFESLGFEKNELSGFKLTSSKALSRESQVYSLSNRFTLKIYDIGKTEISELQGIRDTLKGVNQYQHILDFMDYVRLGDEKGYTLEDFPSLEGVYNYYLNSESSSDSGRALIGQARENPLPDYDGKRTGLSYTITLKLDDYQGLSIHQYLSKDKTWQFSVRYDEINHLVSFVVFYYQGSYDSYLSKEKYHQLIEKRLQIPTSSFMDGIYDKVVFFSNRSLSDTLLEKASYRQLKDGEGKNLLQIETDVQDEKTAKMAVSNLQNRFETESFAKKEVKDKDGNVSYLYSKDRGEKTLSAQVGYQVDSSSGLPVYKLLVLFQS